MILQTLFNSIAAWWHQRDTLKYIRQRKNEASEINIMIDALIMTIQNIHNPDVQSKLDNDVKMLSDLQQINNNRLNRLNQIENACAEYDIERMQVLIEPYEHTNTQFIENITPCMQTILDDITPFGTECTNKNGQKVIKFDFPIDNKTGEN